jgi:hypothetical protein
VSETCRVSCQNKFVKLVRLVGFLITKIVTIHGDINVKLAPTCFGLTGPSPGCTQLHKTVGERVLHVHCVLPLDGAVRAQHVTAGVL